MEFLDIAQFNKQLNDPEFSLNADIRKIVIDAGEKANHADDIQIICQVASDILDLFKKYVSSIQQTDVTCSSCGYWQRHAGLVDSPNGHCFCHQMDTLGVDFCSYHSTLPRKPEVNTDEN